MNKNKELYNWYKSRGICTKCGTNKAKPHSTMCWDCAEKSNMSSMNYYHNVMTADQREKRLVYNNRKRELCIAFGVCRECLKRDATQGKFCLECYIKAKRRNNKKRDANIRRVDRVSYGLCYICGEPLLEGKKTCAKCHTTLQRNILEVKCDNTNHKWRSAL